MTVPFMRAYSLLTIKTCHERGAHAIGGMAAQIPRSDDPEWTEVANNKVLEDKEREAKDGHDGTWVAHPGMVAARQGGLRRVHAAAEPDRQAAPRREPERRRPAGEAGGPHHDGRLPQQHLRRACSTSAAWLAGRGAVPVFNLMEDAATAEISRAQVWQWIHHPKGILEDGTEVTVELFREVLDEELEKIKNDIVGPERWETGRVRHRRRALRPHLHRGRRSSSS